MCSAPSDYLWSSDHANALGRDEPRLHPHASWTALGTTDERRRQRYRELIAAGIPDERRDALALHTSPQNRGAATASEKISRH